MNLIRGPRLVAALLAVLFVTVLVVEAAVAEDCNTDCHAQCGVSIFGARIVEPTCHLKCEAAKKTACAIGTPIPTIPTTTVETVKVAMNQSCIAAYQVLTNAVIAECSNWDGRLDGQDKIQASVRMLQEGGFLAPGELDGLQIRFCPLRGAQGIAADRGRIYLHSGTMANPPIQQAALLAHELTHTRQYRRMGTDNFKCDYSRKYVECSGCQDERHPLEREAYQYERMVTQSLLSRISVPVPGPYSPGPFPTPGPFPMPGPFPTSHACVTNVGVCPLSQAYPVGTPCTCSGVGGIFPGIVR